MMNPHVPHHQPHHHLAILVYFYHHLPPHLPYNTEVNPIHKLISSGSISVCIFKKMDSFNLTTLSLFHLQMNNAP